MRESEQSGKISRRRFLQTVAAATLTASPMIGYGGFLPRIRRKRLRVVFYTDLHTRKEWGTPLALERAAQAINAQKPDLVIGGGDLITDGFTSSAESVEHRWDLYMAFHEAIEAPVQCAIGNHDLVGAIPTDGSAPLADPRSIFREKMGVERAFRSFDFGGYHFVLLDAIDVVGGKLKYRGWVNDEQMDWLKSDISQEREEKGTILVSHIPLLTGFYDYNLGPEAPAPANRVVGNAPEILDLYKESRLLGVLQGHLHVNECLKTRGKSFITGGAVCGKWWRGSYYGTEEGFYVVDLVAEKIESRYVEYGWDARRPPGR